MSSTPTKIKSCQVLAKEIESQIVIEDESKLPEHLETQEDRCT